MDFIQNIKFDSEWTAAVVLVLGFVVGLIVRFALNRIGTRIGDRTEGSAHSVGNALTRAAPLAFWTIIAAVFVWSLRTLDVAEHWELFDTVTEWIPKLVLSFAFIGASHLIGSALRDFVRASIRHPEYARQIGQATYALVLMIGIFFGLQYVGIDVSFLQTLVLIIVGVGMAGFGLAFALGAKDYIANIIGQRELAQYDIGDRIAMDGFEGTIVEINKTNVVLLTNDGRATVPASRFTNNTIFVYSNDS